ncbi:MAG: hypothetical protein ACI9FJ_001607 [Alteromonadaceae bacterium]|jgi:hypothetical protein
MNEKRPLPQDTLLNSEAAEVRQYIAFDGSGKKDHSPQAKLQSIGVAALWHRIEEDHFAYLADEVGMGKTRQAMGVIATLFLRKPNARVVVICPGKPLQEQWQAEWANFVSGCLLVTDGVLKSPLNHDVAMPMTLHDRLSQFSRSLLLDDQRIHLLRYSSFSRPIGFHKAETVDDIQQAYQHKLHEIGIAKLPAQALESIAEVDKSTDDWRWKLTDSLNKQYAQQLQILLRDDARPIDLIVCDEAQYLRHVGNARNTNIKASLGFKQTKWLFLSATPLHSGPHDIQSLDTYLCSHGRDDDTKVCVNNSCVNITSRMNGKPHSHEPENVVSILSEFLLRRPRQYVDKQSLQYNKVAYRCYQTDPAVANNDAFSSMVTALVQKRLVKSLAGKNNKFRQGECSSFESLASSAGNENYKNCDGVLRAITEMEGGNSAAGTTEQTPDRFDIDQLNQSLRDALTGHELVNEATAKQLHLPHPKLYHVADSLAQKCLKNAPNHKTLVFVRRLDTVLELQVLLQQRFQKIIDQRLDSWAKVIAKNGLKGRKTATFNRYKDFWQGKDKDPQIISPDHHTVDEKQHQDGQDDENNDDDGGVASRARTLPYFQAIRAKSAQQDERGMLFSFREKILLASDAKRSGTNPLAFLLPGEAEQTTHCQNPHWRALVDVIYDNQTEIPQWLFEQSYAADIKTLKGCLLLSMRHADFLLELYILEYFVDINTQIKTQIKSAHKGSHNLSDKLVWLLGQAKTASFGDTDLTCYLNNWRQRLKNWCEHYSLIQQKCFKHNHSINGEFTRMGPVVGRSGSIANKYAVTQFKMPCYPNILICTDVLKEGVDMHLFCDEVIHYGVAWTSGDLEQRIGRVDRVNSLIHRRILQHEGERDTVPTLHTGFPYLSGTLDQHQVQRVIKNKVASDRLMDFGKSHDEVKDISIDELVKSEHTSQVTQTQLVAKEYIPTSLRFSGKQLRTYTFAYIKDLPRDDFQNIKAVLDEAITNDAGLLATLTYHSLHPIAAIALSYQLPEPHADHANTLGDNLKSKWTYIKHNKGQKQYRWFQNVSCIVPLSLSKTQTIKVIAQLTASTAVVEPTAISQLTITEAFKANGFEFNSQFKTLALTHDDHIAPYQQTQNRKQTVIIESIGELLLIRSPIVTITDLALQNKDLAQWIGEQNNPLSFGYLNDHADIIWFCCLVAHPVQLGADFNHLTQKISATADRLQQLYTANDKEDWLYQATTPIKTLLADSQNKADFNQLISNDPKN